MPLKNPEVKPEYIERVQLKKGVTSATVQCMTIWIVDDTPLTPIINKPISMIPGDRRTSSSTLFVELDQPPYLPA